VTVFDRRKESKFTVSVSDLRAGRLLELFASQRCTLAAHFGVLKKCYNNSHSPINEARPIQI
jgi:hypothetical protein